MSVFHSDMEAPGAPGPILVEPLRQGWVSATAEVHLAAFRGYMNARLGKPYVVRFLEWFTRAEDGIALVAMDGDRPVGYVVGAPLGYHDRLTRATLPAAALGALVRPWVVFDRDILATAWGRVAGLFRRRAGGSAADEIGVLTYSLVGICVSPAAQGRSAGKLLMTRFEEEARGRGAQRMRLSVYAVNTAARTLYERAGWVLLSDPAEPTLYYHKLLP